MGNQNNTVRFIAVAVAVVAVAFCIGYFVLGNSRSAAPVQTTVIPPSAPAPVPVVAPTRVATVTPRAKNGDYTAPGAPRIHIVEEKTPSMTNIVGEQPKPPTPADTPVKPVDAEASQEGATKPRTTSSDTTDTTSTNSTNSSDTTASSETTDATGSNAAGDSGTDSTSAGSQGDTEASQQGDGQAQFRVQAGTFVAARNAKALADALRDRGYVASTRTERDGDKTVYKVQVGAYRTRAAADKAAQDLQSTGYPASVSPTNP